MGASAALEDRVFTEVKRLCNAGLDETTLLRKAAESLRRVVSFEAYGGFTTDPSSGLMTRAFAEGWGGEKETRLYLDRVYFEEDLGTQRKVAQSRHPVALLSEVTGGKIERALRYREVSGPLGLGHELLSIYSVGRERWGGMALLREHGHPDFDTREVALLRRIAPHLSAGLKLGMLSSQAAAEPESNDVPGMLVLDHRGRVSHHTAAVERWLRDLEDLGPGWREGIGLPMAVRTMVGALRQALKPQTERDLASVPRLCVKGRSGRWLTLQGALTEAQSGHPGATMIIIEPAGPREMIWLKATAYGLSEREKEVMDLAVRGPSTKQIAATLYISEYTVQDHLSNIFDKVGVRGRKALIKRLFFDNLYPSLKPPEPH